MSSNRRSWLKRFAMAVFGISIVPQLHASMQDQSTNSLNAEQPNGALPLGAFSVSLAVKDLEVSKTFYEALGFTAFAGSKSQNYLIMKNGNALVGLFKGMFEKNILTFNPGWNEDAKKLDKFDDVRVIQKHLKSKGIKLETEADEKTSGPASVVLTDPDGNQILLDQHV